MIIVNDVKRMCFDFEKAVVYYYENKIYADILSSDEILIGSYSSEEQTKNAFLEILKCYQAGVNVCYLPERSKDE